MLRTATLVTAVLFTALPFTFAFSGGRITFVMFRDAPVIAAVWWVTAALLWGWHVWIRRRLAVRTECPPRPAGAWARVGREGIAGGPCA